MISVLPAFCFVVNILLHNQSKFGKMEEKKSRMI